MNISKNDRTNRPGLLAKRRVKNVCHFYTSTSVRAIASIRETYGYYTEHSSSSRGQPAVIIDGEALGPIEMPLGELQIPEEVFDLLAKRLRDLGYAVCNSPVDKSWMECWENGIKLDNHWHPEARLVSF